MGIGEVDDRTGKMQIFALSFVKSVSESSKGTVARVQDKLNKLTTYYFLL
jgi:hypothetical protein